MLLLYFPSQSMKDFNLMWSGTLLTSGFVGSGRWGAGGLIPSGTGGQEGNTVLARWCSPSWHFLDVEGSSVQQINNILGQPALQHWMISHTFIILMLFLSSSISSSAVHSTEPSVPDDSSSMDYFPILFNSPLTHCYVGVQAAPWGALPFPAPM